MTKKLIKIRSAYDGTTTTREYAPVGEYSLTKQSHTDDTDINQIIARYNVTGVLGHERQTEGTYGDFTSNDYQESMIQITNANNLFNNLPSGIRAQFNNDPAQMLSFCDDPANADKLVELGLAHPPETASPLVDEALNASGDEGAIEASTVNT
jgi:phage internal scaffolding protein